MKHEMPGGGADSGVPGKPNDTCRNCGVAYTQSLPYCPHCGAETPMTWAKGDLSSPQAPGQLRTGSVAGDIALGILLVWAPIGFLIFYLYYPPLFSILPGSLVAAIMVIALLAGPTAYLFWDKYPHLRKGIGIGFVPVIVLAFGALILLLGALVICATGHTVSILTPTRVH